MIRRRDPVLVIALMLVLLGVGQLLVGWQGFRLNADREVIVGLGDKALKWRQVMLRSGS